MIIREGRSSVTFSDEALDKIEQLLKTIFTAVELQGLKENIKQMRLLP